MLRARQLLRAVLRAERHIRERFESGAGERAYRWCAACVRTGQCWAPIRPGRRKERQNARHGLKEVLRVRRVV